MPKHELERMVVELEEEMITAADELRFEYAAQLRDELRELRRDLREIQAGEAPPEGDDTIAEARAAEDGEAAAREAPTGDIA
jgi:excinuclease UvrABC nuclease subunit